MPRPETIQTEPVPSDWKELPDIWWSWFDDLRLLIQGVEGRQNFINTLTDTKTRNDGVKTFFINETNGDAAWSDPFANEPYIGPAGQMIVPDTIIASKRQIINIGAMKAYQTVGQTFFNGVPGTLTYDTKAFDEDNAMSAGTGIFTPKQAGKYSVTACVGFDQTQIAADTACSIGIAKNGYLVASAQSHTSNVLYPIVITATDLVDMNGTTDYLSVAVQQDFGANATTIGAQYAGYFCAFKAD